MKTPTLCHLPDSFTQDIEQHTFDVDRFLAGDLSASTLKSRRVPRGIYEQRQNGTYMVRVRVPGGAISAAQTRILAGVASRYGGGTLHVTTRQDIQLHDVPIGQTPAVLRELFPAGLTSKGGGGNTVRNVTACPFAGICPAEHFDVTPFVVAVTQYLIALPGSYNLPRKYKIAFSGCGADCALAQVSDLGFIAKVRDGMPGFSVYAGGGMGAISRVGDRMEEWVPAAAVIRIAEAVRRLFDRLGDRRNRQRARLRFAVERVGADAFRNLLRETVKTVTDEGTPACDLPLDLSGKAVEPPPADCRALLTEVEGLNVLRQRQPGYVTVPLPLPLGQISWQALEASAGLAERFSAERMLRATQGQSLQLRFVRESDLDAVRAECSQIFGADALRHGAWSAFTSCTGAATCRLGLCLSQNAARACADALADAGIEPAILQTVDVRLNGCPNACGQHPMGAIGSFGVAQRVGDRLIPAYRVLLGARRGEGRTRLGTVAGSVPARALPAFLIELLRDYQTGRQPEEIFADYYDRQGMGHFQYILERHTRTPAYADHPEFYRDWGSTQDFSLAGRSAGECSSGVFEVIAEDLATARKILDQAENAADPGDGLFRSLLATTRALLITRGIDTHDSEVIFKTFETYFVETSLVDVNVRYLLKNARDYREGRSEALADSCGDIRTLLDRVAQLYSTMDAELRFHVTETKSSAQPV